MSKAEEFSLLHSAWKKAWEVESDQIGMPITDEREGELSEFVTENGDLIARALRLLDAVDNPERCAEFVHARIVAKQQDYSPMQTADRIALAFREAVQ